MNWALFDFRKIWYNIQMNKENEELVRLNKFISKNGLVSRRSADRLISYGKIIVNGEKVKELGVKINPEKDIVVVDGKKIEIQDEKVYYALNKPVGYVTTSSDPQGRQKVTDLVPDRPKVYSVGRLDFDSCGLLLLTNDGDLTYKLTHPKFEKEKEYRIKAKITNNKSQITNKSQIQISKNKLPNYLITKLLNGIRLKEGIAKADEVKIIDQMGDEITFTIILHQGWNRQIRRMCATVGLDVLELKRIRIGGLKLGNIKEGEWKRISVQEIKKYF